MPIRSKTAKHPKKIEELKILYPLPKLPEKPEPQVKKDPTVTQIKKALYKFGDYLERNQRAYHRDHPYDTTWEEDIINIPGRVVRKTGGFGEEQREYLRSQCRQDDDILPSSRIRTNLQFKVKGTPSHKKTPYRRPRRRRSNRQRVYVPRGR